MRLYEQDGILVAVEYRFGRFLIGFFCGEQNRIAAVGCTPAAFFSVAGVCQPRDFPTFGGANPANVDMLVMQADLVCITSIMYQ